MVSALACAIQSTTQCFAAMHTTGRKRSIDAPKLARNWSIGLQAAKQTVKVNTQRGICSIANPSLSCRLHTNDWQLRYRRLWADVFTDTLVASVPSRHQNKYAQVFCTSFGWTRCYPMKSKSNAHEALLTMFAQDGVPNVLIMDRQLGR